MNIFIPDWAPNIHPMVIHFPIVLLNLAVLLQLLSILIKNTLWLAKSTVIVMGMGSVAAIVTYFTGRQAADLVNLPVQANTALSSHADLALWTVLFFVLLTVMQFTVWRLKTKRKLLMHLILFGLGLVGLFLVLKTTEQGGKLVYKYGVGVTANDKINQINTSRAVDSIATSLKLGDNGDWILIPGSDIQEVFSTKLSWLKGSKEYTDLNFIQSTEGKPIIELKVLKSPIFFVAGDQLENIQADLSINLCDFNGTVSLAHHVLDSSNYDYISVNNKSFIMGRVSEGEKKVMGEKAMMADCWLDIRAIGDGKHFRSYLSDQLMLHGHGKVLPPGKVGLNISGQGTIYIKSLQVRSLLESN